MLVLNIETVADPNLPAALLPKEEDYMEYKKPETREAHMKEDIAKLALSPLTGKIVCIATLDTDNPSNNISVWSGDNDFVLVSKLVNQIKSHLRSHDNILTYNGKSFDIPFLFKSAIRLGIEFLFSDYMNLVKKYSIDYHIDMYEILSDFGVNRKGTLSDWCARLNIDPPFGKGEQVQEWYNTKDWASIEKHCSENVDRTYKLYLRTIFR